MIDIPGLPQEIAVLIDKAPGKRALKVIQHIIEHGQVSTEDLKAMGYEHPPRAARDVRECGIPLETISVQSSEGKTIAAYRFADLSAVERSKAGGRRTFSKQFKQSLYAQAAGKCSICLTPYEERYLQIDHRVPYEVGGEGAGTRTVGEYMLVCGSCNRAKSWSCEHCSNWLTIKDPSICLKCYWGMPEDYMHVALREIRRLDIVWHEGEVDAYDQLKARADGEPMPQYVKAALARLVADS